MVLALTLSLAGCGGGGSAPASEPTQPVTDAPIGPIPAAEFATVPPPTFNQVIAAFRTVTTANPTLLVDEPALSRALFDEVRRSMVGAGASTAAGRAEASAAVGPATRLAVFDLNSKLTLEEWKVVIRSPLNSARAANTIEASAQAAIDRMPCDADVGYLDGKADAVRHAYWNALMTRRTSAAFAEAFATAHEIGSTNTPAATAMDLHNNAAGRALAQRFAAATEGELLELLLQQAFTLVPAGSAIPAGLPGLVFIAERARRPFDGSFTGTLTQPDSGAGAWTLEFNLSQCGTVLRGFYRAVRGAVAFERRFSGALTSATSLTLDFAEPLAYEPAAGQGVCRAMQALLSGSERALSGPWTSARCPQGGIITIQR